MANKPTKKPDPKAAKKPAKKQPDVAVRQLTEEELTKVSGGLLKVRLDDDGGDKSRDSVCGCR